MIRYTLKYMVIILALLVNTRDAEACTAITLIAEDGSLVQGRTLEWGAFYTHSKLLIIPRGTDLSGVTPDGKPGLPWKTTYGVLGVNSMDRSDYTDGLNEKGLAVSLLYLSGYAKYQPYDPLKAHLSISQSQLATWILTSFATTDEVREMLPNIRVVPVPEAEIGGIPAPFHFLVSDQSGKTIVIEYTEGKLHIYDNKVGVMTNSPEFPWHLKNLGNYVTHSIKPVKPMKVGDMEIRPLGVGSGLLGLPGDFTPPSRFIRAAAFRNTVPELATGARAIEEAFRILNNFDIPIGTLGEDSHDPSVLGDTQWTGVMDTQSLRYYYRTMYNHRIRVVDLKAIDFNKPGIRFKSLDEKQKQDYEVIEIE